MNPGTIALIVIALSVAGWAAFMANVTIRRQRKAAFAEGAASREHPGAGTTTEATGRARRPLMRRAQAQREAAGGSEVTVERVPERERKPLTPAQLAVSRRQFLNRATTASFSVFLGLFGMSTLSFLWPRLTGGFGTRITVGDYEDLLSKVGPPTFQPLFVPEGRFWLTYYEGTGEAPIYLAVNAVDTKVQALYRKCVHLGCSVPHCSKSMLFECPCHGSKYLLSGEYYGGPAPRGLDRFPVEISGGKLVVDTGAAEVGPPRGTDTWERFSGPVGPFCVPT